MGKSSPTKHRRAKLAPGSRLPPDVVRASQRERLMIALIDVVDRQGLPATTVADLIERAHVSRAAFYEQFDSLEHCFLATYDTHTGRVGAQIVSSYNTPGLSWPKRIQATMGTLAGAADSWPAAARVCLSDVLTAGPPAHERTEQMIALVRHMLRQSRTAVSEQRSPVSRQAAVVFTGGLRRVIYNHLRTPDEQPASELARELTGWLLTCSLPSLRDSSARRSPSQGRGEAKGRANGRAARVDGRELRTSPMLQANGSIDAPLDARPDPNGRRADTPNGRQADSPDSSRVENVSGRGSDGAGERRDSIVDAVLELAATKGYRAMTHRDIARCAKVSYSTFYNHFENKQDALLAACQVAHERLAGVIGPASAEAPDWAHGVRAGVAAYLRTAAEHPEEARILGLEVFNAGHACIAQVDRHAHELERLLAPGFELSPATSCTAARAFAGAALELLRHHAAEDQIAELPEAAPELSYIALAPFVGRKDAQRIASYRPPYAAAAPEEEPLALDRAGARRRAPS
jgi:AcrR family transcriptional regulator